MALGHKCFTNKCTLMQKKKKKYVSLLFHAGKKNRVRSKGIFIFTFLFKEEFRPVELEYLCLEAKM